MKTDEALLMHMSKPVLVLLCSLLLLCFSSTVSAAGGVDVEPDIESSPISNITHSTEVADESTWSISVSLEESAANNSTSVRILKQMCTNEGVCYAPQWIDADPSSDNQTWSASWFTIDDHAYVNWKVELDYEDGESEEFPTEGYAKAWSSCWHDIDSDEWGGKDCPDGPPSKDKSETEESGFLPAVSVLASGAMIFIAAVVSRGSK